MEEESKECVKMLSYNDTEPFYTLKKPYMP